MSDYLKVNHQMFHSFSIAVNIHHLDKLGLVLWAQTPPCHRPLLPDPEACHAMDSCAQAHPKWSQLNPLTKPWVLEDVYILGATSAKIDAKQFCM